MRKVTFKNYRRLFLPSFLLRIDLRFALTLFSVALLCGIWTETYQELKASRANAMADARRDAQSLSRLFLEHAYRTIEAADQAAIYLRYRFANRGTTLDLPAEIDNGLVARNVYNLFSIVDEKGNVILSSKPFSPVNLADREHIRVHMTGDADNLFISKPVLGRVSQRWSLQLTRRLNHPDGSFGGVVVVSMDPQYFTHLYHEIDVGKYGAISLVGADGIVRVRRTGSTDAMGENVTEGKVFGEMMRKPQGIVEFTSVIDGRTRLYAYKKLPNYPLYASVGIDLEERLAQFHADRNRTFFLVGLLTVGIIAFNASMLWLISSLMHSRREALAASEAKSRFLSNMSHELRTPLNGILGYSDALREELRETSSGEFAAIIHESGTRLLMFVNSILELTALEDHQVAVNLCEENFRELIMQAVGRHSRDAQDKGLQLEWNVAQDVPTELNCDGDKILRVLDNLLGNAIRFTEKGRVTVQASRNADGALEVRVKDTGIGIPQDKHDRIFEKFAQLDDSPNRMKDGAGLGLTIAKRLATLMGGELLLQSTENNGSTFTLVLPVNGTQLSGAAA
jgi:two-component system, NarL family, sensor histidine kinase BarA